MQIRFSFSTHTAATVLKSGSCHLKNKVLLKTVAFIAGKSENPAAWIFFIRFSIDNCKRQFVCIKLALIEFWMLSHLWDNFLSFKTREFCLFDVNCKIDRLSNPGDFVTVFTPNKKISDCWIWRNRDAIATSVFSPQPPLKS